MTKGGAQARKLLVQVAARFWLTDSLVANKKKQKPDDPSQVFLDRYVTFHPLFEVTVTIERSGSVLFEQVFKRGEGADASNQNANVYALDPFIAELKSRNAAGDRNASPTAGPFKMTLKPGETQSSFGPASPDSGFAVGPAVKGHDFETEYRPLEVSFKLDDAFRVSAPSVTSIAENRGPNGNAFVQNGTAGSPENQVLMLDWRFDWLRRTAPKIRPKPNPRVAPVSVIVLHQTGNATSGLEGQNPHPKISNTLDAFVGRRKGDDVEGGVITAHYVVDVDGHVVKMGDERDFLHHAGHSAWRDATDISSVSVGIEHVHNTEVVGFPDAQIKASLDLVELLMKEHDVKPFNVVGHDAVRCIAQSDVNGDPPRRAPPSAAVQADLRARLAKGGFVLNPFDRRFCPGATVGFPWRRYEDRGLAVGPLVASAMPADAPSNYALFISNPTSLLRVGSNNATVKEVQEDLLDIGWPLSNSHPNNSFDNIMQIVVMRFQEHFLGHFSGPIPAQGVLDAETGALIKRVVASLRALGAAKRP